MVSTAVVNNAGGFLVRYSATSPNNLTVAYTRDKGGGVVDERHCFLYNLPEVVLRLLVRYLRRSRCFHCRSISTGLRRSEATS